MVGDKDIFNKLEQIKKTMEEVKKYKIGIGFFNNKSNERNDTDLTNAEIAIKNNLGIGVPTRPFFTTSMDNNAKKYTDNSAKKIIDNIVQCNKNKVIEVYKNISSQGREDVKQSVVDWKIPANSPQTIKKKGKDDPLRDTDQMLNAIEGKVLKK